MHKNISRSSFVKAVEIFLAHAVFITVILLGIFIYSSARCIKQTDSRMTRELNYISRQCVLYNERADASQTESLISLADKTQEFRRVFADLNAAADDSILAYLDAQRMTGFVFTDNSTGITRICGYDGDDLSKWSEIIEKVAASGVSENTIKAYTERVSFENYIYDYVAIGRTDTDGVIIGYSRQETTSVSDTERLLRGLLTEYNFESTGKLCIVRDNIIVASNVTDLNGIPADNSQLMTQARSISDCSEPHKISTSDDTYYVMRDKCRDYYLYAFIPKSRVFTERKVVMSFAAVLISIIGAISVFAYYRITGSRRAEHMRSLEVHQQELDRLANDAIRANEAKSDFLRRISHDIRTPINGMRGMLDIAEHSDDDPQKRHECYVKMREASGYLLDLISDVLDLSKLEQGQQLWRNESFDIARTFDEMYDIVNHLAEENGLTLTVDRSEITHAALIGSSLALKRIFQNIVVNAMKYSRDGGYVKASLRETGCSDGKASFEFICEDNGIGMSEEFQKRMFEPFEQEDSSCKASYNGSGLGLSIVKCLVDQLEGEITVNSKQGVGTTVCISFSLPVDTAEHISDTYDDASPDTDISPNAPLSGLKILLTEDNKLNMEITEFVLENAGATVIKAWNGRLAVDAFKASEPYSINVILMDMMMPVMDGISATKEIRALSRPDAAEIPIIAITANAYSDDVDLVKSSGMNEHLSKPVDAQALIKAVLHYYKPSLSGEKVSWTRSEHS